MIEDERFIIKEIYSVDFVKPNKTEKKKIFDRYIPRYQLIYKISGEVITNFNEKKVRITPGTAYIIPKSDNAVYSIERTEVGDCIDIFFDTDYKLTDELMCLDFSSDSDMENLFRMIYRLWITKTDGYYCKALSIIYDILYKMILKNKKYTPGYKYKKIEKGVLYIRNHLYDNSIDYYVPSKICGISYTYFKKIFIEKFGIPPVKYVNEMRLERSRELLLTNHYSVCEIAKICGFENTYYFSKKFKEKYRHSPTAFKKLMLDI